MIASYVCFIGGMVGLVCIIWMDRVRRLERIRYWYCAYGKSSTSCRKFLGRSRKVRRDRRLTDTAHFALMVTEASAYLQSGMPTERTWQRVWERFHGGTSGPPEHWEGIDSLGVPRFVKRLAENKVATLGGVLRSGTFPWCRKSAAAVFKHKQQSGLQRAAHMLIIACRVSTELGTPLAQMLQVVAESIDESESINNARRIARSGPVSSARILCALPLIGVLLGEFLGAHPIRQFSDGRIGSLCAVTGLSFLLVGLAVIRRMLRKSREEDELLDPAYMCDLMQAGIMSGAAVPTTLVAIGRSGNIPECERIGQELTLGASWEEAWEPHPRSLSLLADVLEATWKDGTSPLTMLERAAIQMRRRRVSYERVQAEKLTIRLVVPLGLFLLPAFIFLGVVPLIIHLGISGFGGV